MPVFVRSIRRIEQFLLTPELTWSPEVPTDLDTTLELSSVTVGWSGGMGDGVNKGKDETRFASGAVTHIDALFSMCSSYKRSVRVKWSKRGSGPKGLVLRDAIVFCRFLAYFSLLILEVEVLPLDLGCTRVTVYWNTECEYVHMQQSFLEPNNNKEDKKKKEIKCRYFDH